MKAKILVDYLHHKKGSEFIVNEIKKTRCSLLINGTITDFGISEVELITKRTSDLFEIGKDIISLSNDFIMRNTEIEKHIKSIKYPLPINLRRKAVHFFLNGC